MRVYKRPRSSVWQIEIATPEGKRRFSSRTTLKREAIEVATYQQQAANDSRNLGKSKSITLKEACETYVDDQRGKAKATYSNALFNTRHLLDGLIWKPMVPFESLTTKQIQNLQKLKVKHGLGHNSVNHITTALTTMRNRAEDWEVLVPTFKVKKLKKKEKFRYLRDGEEGLLLKAIHDKGLKDLTILLLDTGLRICEAVALMYSDISTEKGIDCFVVYRNKTDIRSLIPITKRLKTIIRDRQSVSVSDYIFPHKTVSGEHRTTATKSLIRAADRAGLNKPQIVSKLGKFTAHSCRDTYATRLVRAGMTLYQVQVMLGHTSPTMTQKYAHLATGDMSSQVLTVLSKYISEAK